MDPSTTTTTTATTTTISPPCVPTNTMPRPSTSAAVMVGNGNMKGNAGTESVSSQSTKSILCRRCQKRNASKGCSVRACHVCCNRVAEAEAARGEEEDDDYDDDAATDAIACPQHAPLRAKQRWKQLVLEKRTDVQLYAAAKRKMMLPKNKFHRERGFAYVGDTVVIWNIREYHKNPKWREDARRKSVRRQQTEDDARMIRAAKCAGGGNTAGAGGGNTEVEGRQNDKEYSHRIKNSRKRFRRLVELKYQEYLRTNHEK